jgi:hypothetical protein
MKAITAPINVSSPREIIANLQVALQTSLGRGAIPGNHPNARQALSQRSDLNAKGRVYGRATARALNIFQRERNDAMVILPDHLHVLRTPPVGNCDYPTQWMLIKTGFSRQIPKDEQCSESRQAKESQTQPTFPC